MRKLMWLTTLTMALAVAATGCSSDACEDLAEVCDGCPSTGDGPVARASCQRTVDSGVEQDCEDRITNNTYEAVGCRPVD